MITLTSWDAIHYAREHAGAPLQREGAPITLADAEALALAERSLEVTLEVYPEDYTVLDHRPGAYSPCDRYTPTLRAFLTPERRAFLAALPDAGLRSARAGSWDANILDEEAAYSWEISRRAAARGEEEDAAADDEAARDDAADARERSRRGK